MKWERQEKVRLLIEQTNKCWNDFLKQNGSLILSLNGGPQNLNFWTKKGIKKKQERQEEVRLLIEQTNKCWNDFLLLAKLIEL